MTTPHCAVCACSNQPGDELIVALKDSVGLAAVCEAHADGIRSGELRARPVISAFQTVELELLPAA